MRNRFRSSFPRRQSSEGTLPLRDGEKSSLKTKAGRSFMIVACVFCGNYFMSWLLYTSNADNLLDRPTRHVYKPDGRSNKKWIRVYNPWNRARFVCGERVRHKSSIIIRRSACGETVINDPKSVWLFTRVFPVEPGLPDIDKMHPNIHSATTASSHERQFPKIRIRYAGRQKRSFQTEPCNVPCDVYGSINVGNVKQSLAFLGTPFQMKYISMEGPKYHPHLEVDHDEYKNHRFYATTSFKSDTPITYNLYGDRVRMRQNPYKTDARYSQPVDFDTAIKGASFIARNCRSKNNREDIVQALINSTLRIDSLSSCIPHTPFGVPDIGQKHIKGWGEQKIALMSKYVFHLAFENQNADDYITEKLWFTLESGTIPVYFGAPNIRDHLPHPKSVILAQDFAFSDSRVVGNNGKTHNINTTALARYLIEVANNRTLYESYHTWRRPWSEEEDNRIRSLVANASLSSNSNDDIDQDDRFYLQFLNKMHFSTFSLSCRICRLGYAKTYGWRWDRERQDIRAPELPSPFLPTEKIHHERTTCFDYSTRHMIYPLKEIWDDSPLLWNNNNLRQCDPSDVRQNQKLVKANNGKKQVLFLRQVQDHDGVTDMELIRQHGSTQAETPSTFRLLTPFANATKLILVRDHNRYELSSSKVVQARDDHYWKDRGSVVWIEDGKSRIVLMADWPHGFERMEQASKGNETSANEMIELEVPGSIKVSIPKSPDRFRLRWIIEDIDTFHSSLSSAILDTYGTETYFSSIMVDDFFHPIELEAEECKEIPHEEGEKSRVEPSDIHCDLLTRE